MIDYSSYHIKPEKFNGHLNLQDKPFNPDDTVAAGVIFTALALIGMFFLSIGFPILGIVLLAPFIVFIVYCKDGIKKNEAYKEKRLSVENQKLKDQADKMTEYLIDILRKTEKLSSIALLKQVNSIKETLNQLKYEFSENALIPFWDEFENCVKKFDSYKESLSILNTNKKIYYQIVHTTNNTFPKDFPFNIKHQFPEQILFDFESIKREAFKKFEFANIWEQRKTQKILAFGFSTLKDAIDNMSYSITDAINDLNMNISSGFENLISEIRISHIQNHDDYVNVNETLEKNLKRIDDKLYYIQYNQKPSEPFGKPF